MSQPPDYVLFTSPTHPLHQALFPSILLTASDCFTIQFGKKTLALKPLRPLGNNIPFYALILETLGLKERVMSETITLTQVLHERSQPWVFRGEDGDTQKGHSDMRYSEGAGIPSGMGDSLKKTLSPSYGDKVSSRARSGLQ